MRVENQDPVTSIADNQAYHGLEGTYVTSGWSVSVGESGSAIVLDVDAGEGQLENTTLSTTADEVELSSGDTDNPRRDVIYVTSNSTIEVLMGDPAAPPVDTDGNQLGPETAPVPAPHDFSNISGIPIAHVWVPAGAEDTSNLQDSLHVNDIRLFVDIAASGGSTETVDERYLTIGPADLSEGDGAYAEDMLSVQNGDTIKVVEWGATYVNGGAKNDPPAGVSVGLYDPGGVPVQTEETALTRNSNGIVTEEATSSGVNHYTVRLTNNSTQSFDETLGQGLGAQFVVQIE